MPQTHLRELPVLLIGALRTRRTRLRRDQNGQSLTELALTLPIVTLFLLGAVNLGLALRAHTSLTQATQQAAQFLIHHPVNYPGACGSQTLEQCTANEVQTFLAANGFANTSASVSFTQTSSTSQSLLATISVSSPFPVTMLMVGLLNVGPLHNGSLTLVSSANTIMATPPPTNLRVTSLQDQKGAGFTLTWRPAPNPAAVPLTYRLYWFGVPYTITSPSTPPVYDSGLNTWTFKDYCVTTGSSPACGTGLPPTYAYGVTSVQNNGLESPAVTAVSP